MAVSAEKISKDVIIVNELGLHARSAAKIAKQVKNAKSKVWLLKGEERVDASDMMEILTIACPRGSEITLEIDDPRDMDILNDLVELVRKGFGE
ncbi:MAG: HPr family phosphocarrier protein [Desulfobacterales bacterium]|nr:HPr family phosphocarrier protein [Desulfobacterales bacterium]